MKKFFLIIITFIFFSLINCSFPTDEVIVRYVVSGTATAANIQYSFGDDSITLNGQSLPWEYSYKLWADDFETYDLFLSGEKTAFDGSTLNLAIYVDGLLMNSASFNGPNEKQIIYVRVKLDGGYN
jgi:hypothetical protein